MNTPNSDYAIASRILGEDFISPLDIANARNIDYGNEALEHLASTLPCEEELSQLRDQNFVLIAGPPILMSSRDINRSNEEERRFLINLASTESALFFIDRFKAGPDWITLRKDILPDSNFKIWDDQLKLVPSDEEVPNDAQVCWTLDTYNLLRGVWLLDGFETRTSSHLKYLWHQLVVSCFRSIGIGGDFDNSSKEKRLGLVTSKKINWSSLP